ncbi:MAG TPA: hypothetical protein GX699_07050 [Firmicutes bacterium]|jgi:hypothetical protein|nr:hypothetical protein [Bacillota bacterium]
MRNHDNGAWTAVFEAATYEEATVVKGMLEAAKIPVALDRDSVGDGLGITDGLLSEVVVKVPKSLAGKAVQLLQAKQMLRSE